MLIKIQHFIHITVSIDNIIIFFFKKNNRITVEKCMNL